MQVKKKISKCEQKYQQKITNVALDIKRKLLMCRKPTTMFQLPTQVLLKTIYSFIMQHGKIMLLKNPFSSPYYIVKFYSLRSISSFVWQLQLCLHMNVIDNHLVQSVESEDIHNITAALFTELYIQQHLHRPIAAEKEQSNELDNLKA